MFFKNYFRSLREHKLAYALNILRLTLAFIPFMIIAVQLQYDLTFDRFHRDYKNIYRVERSYIEETGEINIPWISYPVAQDIISSSPYIVAGSALLPFNKDQYVMVENGGNISGFNEQIIPVLPDFTKVFDFDMVEGLDTILYEPGKVLIPLSLAKKFYGGNSAVGQSLKTEFAPYMADTKDFIVGGVYRDFPSNSQLQNGIYTKLSSTGRDVNSRGNRNYMLYIRLSDPSMAEIVAQNYKDQFIATGIDDSSNKIILTPLPDLYYMSFDNDPYGIHGSRSTTITLASIILLILLIAGTNYTTFSMAMVPFRIRYVNTRKVLGATVSSLRWGMIADALVTVFIAFLLSIVLVYCVSDSSLREVITTDFSPAENLPILGITLLIAIATGIIAELYPSRYITSFQPAMVLKGSFGLSANGRALRKMLIALQFIVSIVLIAMALIINKQNRFMCESDLGIDRERLMAMNISANSGSKRDAIVEKIRNLDVVEEAAFSNEKICAVESYQNWGFSIEQDKAIQSTIIPVSWDLLKVLGVEIIEGRYPEESDQKNDLYTLVITKKTQENEGIEVRQYGEGWDVIGVCENVQVMSMRKELTNTAFLIQKNVLSYSGYVYIRLKPEADPVDAIREIRKAYSDFDPIFPAEVEFFDTTVQAQYKSEMIFQKTINWCSILAILISMMGIFGLIFFDTQQRRKEMSLRRIMGATNKELLWNINRPYIILLAGCYAISVPIIIYISHIWLSSFKYQIAAGPWIYILSLIIILSITIVTINLQAIRTLYQNPVESIKIE